MAISSEARRAINLMKRDQIQKILESYGYEVYDHEATEDLRKNVLDDVESGVISEDDVLAEPSHLPDCRDR